MPAVECAYRLFETLSAMPTGFWRRWLCWTAGYKLVYDTVKLHQPCVKFGLERVIIIREMPKQYWRSTRQCLKCRNVTLRMSNSMVEFLSPSWPRHFHRLHNIENLPDRELSQQETMSATWYIVQNVNINTRHLELKGMSHKIKVAQKLYDWMGLPGLQYVMLDL